MNISRPDPDGPQASEPPDGRAILHIGQDRRKEAITRLLAPPGRDSRLHAERFLEYASSSGLPLDNLWALADNDDHIAATVLAVPNPGRTALLFATQPATAEAAADTGRVIDHASRMLSESGLHLAQVLLEPKDQLTRNAFLAGGFSELAILSYLQRPIPRKGSVDQPVWPAGVRVEPYAEDRRQDMLLSLQASYEQTLDCPGLTGLRDPSDILEGHQATGRFEPDLWTLLYIDDRPNGALLLNPATTKDTVELVYVGLGLAARGQGLGRSLVRHGLISLAGRNERTITVAADERNTPAMSLYQGEGFHRISRRLAMIRSLRKPPENQVKTASE